MIRLLVLCTLFLPCAALAQVPYHTWPDTGSSVAGAGDIDLDGLDDVVVGAAGGAHVYSGSDGSLLHVLGITGTVAGGGDVDGDGHPDLIVGEPDFDGVGVDSGRVHVYSGASGALLHSFPGEAALDVFGLAVAHAGDVDSDGYADVLVGARGHDAGGDGAGRAQVFSGFDGAVLHTIDGGAVGDAFGSSVSGAGDLDGDGIDDIVVAAPLTDFTGLNSGRVYAFSGKDGSLIHTTDGANANDQLGGSLSAGFHFNGDGVGDLVIGADPGAFVRLVSGSTGSLIRELTSPGDECFACACGTEYFAWHSSGVRDVDGDGRDDVIVSSEEFNGFCCSSGHARVFSGADGTLLHALTGNGNDDRYACRVSGAGDVDGDGRGDFALSVCTSGPARTEVYLGASVGDVYCVSNSNSTGKRSKLRARGSRRLVDDTFVLTGYSVPTGEPGYYLASQTQAFVPFFGGSQGNLCLGGSILRFAKNVQVAGPSQTMCLVVDLQNLPSGTVFHPGETWNFQLWFRDKDQGSPTSNTSEGIAVLFE